jgi:hypothetical protein
MRLTWPGALRLAVLCGFAIVLQWGGGAYRSEAAGDPDEPAHLVTGLMAREYVKSGWGRVPIEFAREYYLHYPKVAIGHWPPVFYAEQALWSLVFPVSHQSLLVMMAVQSALLGALLWPLLRRRFGPAAAWCGVLVLATLPGLAAQGAMVMTEIPEAVLILLATLAWGEYVESGRAKHAIAFGVLSAAAIMTKGTGLVLAGMPLLSVWLAGRVDLLRRATFWIPGIIVLTLCAPWYLLAPAALHQRVQAFGGLGFVIRHLSYPATAWPAHFGWTVTILAVAGLVVLLYQRATGSSLDSTWASVTALVIAATVTPVFFGAWEARHVVEAAPEFLLLAAAGAGWIASRPSLRRIATPYKLATLAMASLLLVGWNVTRLPRHTSLGYRELAGAIAAGSFGPARTIVTSGDSIAEGTLISEIALREPRPIRYIVRGTKLFADISWMGQVAELRVNGAAQLYAMLMPVPVDLVVIDRVAAAPYPYQPQLEQALTEHPDQWQRVDSRAYHQRFDVFRRTTDGPALSSSEIAMKLQAVLANPVP